MRYFIVFLFLVTSVFNAEAQLRHIKGINGTGLNWGLTRYGKVIELEYVHFFTNKLYLSSRATYEYGRYSPALIRFSSIGLINTVYYTIVSAREKFYLSTGGGLSLFFDKARESEVPLSDAIPFGIHASIQGEYYVANQLSFYLDYTQHYLFIEPKWGAGRWTISLGFRVYF